MGLLEKIFGNYSEKEIKRITPIVDKIDALAPEFEKLSDEELKHKTTEFKERLSKGETLDQILPEAYAAVREAASRALGMRHFRVQLLGGIVMHQGRIAEMRTGEGKTLVATLSSYLNALEGKGVHVVTVNDYLAKRDSEWVTPLFEKLNMTVGVILNDMENDERRAAYACDITYATNNELGFDYLRDNMVVREESMVQRELNFAIIDEVDSVLIDEARTPLIISGSGAKSTELYKVADTFVKTLKKGKILNEEEALNPLTKEEIQEEGDYILDEKAKSVTLTQEGVKKAEKFFHIENLSDAENLEIQHHINNALKANYNMHIDQNYVVQNDEVMIVDEFTGRIMPGRRYSDGLHQAIEAKENVKVKKESRIDHHDVVYRTEAAKFRAVVKDIIACHEKHQPVLVGTITIDKSEQLSKMLKKEGIKHQVLNAKYHEQEAEIVSHAGELDAVTIATNMAGRGTDIKLEDGVPEIGGLKIIGTERHESRRIDNQLRGRSGRQGDPGESKFYISMEDELMRLFGSEKTMKLVDAMGLEEDDPIEAGMLTRAIENAQKKVEGNNFAIRKHLLEYDQVMNEQREIIYGERHRVLIGENLRESIMSMIGDVVDRYVDAYTGESEFPEEWDMAGLSESLGSVIPIGAITIKDDSKENLTRDNLKQTLKKLGEKIYEMKEQEIGDPERMRELERVILLRVIDQKWMDHIDDMEQMRQGIGLHAYAQRDPLIEYKFAGYDMFEELSNNIQEDTLRMLYRVKLETETTRVQTIQPMFTNKDDTAQKKPKERKEAKIGRNDLCPCGSGKKYKNCCGKDA